jgi:endonuclease/exonuclease/phosphatase family metal-dependent hydrolase
MRKKNIKSVFVLILATFLMGCAHLWAEPKTVERETADDVRVMSWNILYKGWEKKGHASWKERVPSAVQILRKHQPDVVGLQEDSKDQVAYITKWLGDYTYLDPYKKRGGGLLIRTKAWRVIKSGKIPIPGKRHASWALLESTRNSERWLFYNAHFIHRTAENSAADRMKAAVQIAQHMARHAPYGVPVVMTGDFNALHDMPVMQYLGGDAGSPVQFSNAFNMIHGGDDPRGTWRGLGKEHHGERIDHILIDKHVTVQDVEIIYYDELSGAWPSDHYPVQAILSSL